MSPFKLKVNGGAEVDITTRHSEYSMAVMEAFGILPLSKGDHVEIWVPDLLPHGYGPYNYVIDNFKDCDGREYVCPAVMAANSWQEHCRNKNPANREARGERIE